ncbi:MAG: FAD-dependent thymidylate synthase [Chlamydiia bacterium]
MQSPQSPLSRFVSNTKENIFVLLNLPEVIKGALFSRYSRSRLGLRELLEKDFLQNQEAGFSGAGEDFSTVNVQKAIDFYDRILDGYGDDSVAELGGAHVAFEEVSMLAAKVLEDCRIGGSPLEKSTRYIPFNEKSDGKWRYYRDPTILESEFGQEYIQMMDFLFETYSALIAPMTERIEKLYPLPEGSSEAAWRTSVRALVFDCLRGILPASTQTNLGFYGNGRFFEALLMKMRLNPLAEVEEIAEKGFCELSKVIPSFVKRANKDHRHFKAYEDYMESLKGAIESLEKPKVEEQKGGFRVHLVSHPQEGTIDQMIGSLLYETTGADYSQILEFVGKMGVAEKSAILEQLGAIRKNRRHKSPRALEHLDFTFEVTADFGCYRDLHRHRILTQERQKLTCHLGYVIPQEIAGTQMEPIYVQALEKARQFFLKIEKKMPDQAQYAVPMAYNIRWYVKINLRSLQWMAELRSTPQGHPEYRKVAQEMTKRVLEVLPVLEPLLSFVDWSEHAIGRLAQEERNLKKRGEVHGV